MSTTRRILSTFDLATGLYVNGAYFSGTLKYWTGAAWTTTFASAEQLTFGSTTLGAATAYSWIATDSTGSDDGVTYMFGWESGITPSSGTYAVSDAYNVAGSTIIQGSSAAVTALSGAIAKQDFEIAQGAIHAFSVTFTDENGAAVSYSGHTVKMVVSDLAGTWMFQNTGVVSGDDNNVITVSVLAANTTTALSSACDGTSLLHYWQDTTSGDCILRGALIVRAAVAAH